MNNKEQQKRALRLQHSVKAQKDAPGRRWADRQVADVRGGNHKVTSDTEISAGRIGQTEIGGGAVHTGELADNTVTQAKMTDGSVGTGELRDGEVTNSKIAGGAVTPSKLDRDYVEPGNTGSATVNTLGAAHSHSISSTTYIKQPKSERMRMLADRTDLHALLESDALSPSERVQAQNTLNLLTLLMDYQGLDAYERERRFADPDWTEWSSVYKQVYGVDEYAEDDRKNFLAYTLGEGTDHTHVRMDPYTGIAPVE